MQSFPKKKQYASPHFYHLESVTESSRCLPPLLESASLISNIHTSLCQELASPFVQVALCPGLNDPRLTRTLGRAHASLDAPFLLLIPKDKAFAFPYQTQRPQRCSHDCTDFLNQVVCGKAHKMAEAPKSVTPRVL